MRRARATVRRALVATYQAVVRATVRRWDHRYHDPAVPLAQSSAHGRMSATLAELADQPGKKVLEIGSREVTGPSVGRKIFSRAEYVGFDIEPGGNVDVVGDIHHLSDHFTERFDLVFSWAVFEHLAMPWRAAEEIAKVLKPGGYVFVETHFSFSAHDRPWHFFQFSDMALKVLFSPELGFECLDAGVSNPIVGRFSALADPYLRYKPIPGLYCHASYLGRKVRDVPDFRWEGASLDSLTGGTRYPSGG